MKRIMSCLLFMVLLAYDSFLFSCNNNTDHNGTVALHNCIIIDGTGSQPLKDGVILIRDGRIERVGSSDKLDIPSGYNRIDLKGAYVLPGFINAHVHGSYNERTLENWLKGGVTSVRDLGPHGVGSDRIAQKRDELNRKGTGSRLIVATPLITAPGGYGGCYVNSPDDAGDKVVKFAEQGVDIIKIAIEDDLQGSSWPMLPPEEIKTIIDTAHSRGRRVSAHISHVRNLSIAIESGVDDISHMAVEPLDDETIRKMVGRDIYWTPTLELWRGVSKMHGLNWDQIAVDNLSRFYRAGGKVALGTDYEGYTCSFDSGFPITEVQLMQQAGMTNMDIITASTQNAAHVCDKDGVLGVLKEGAIADIVIVKGNPLDNMEVLVSPYMVIHNGTIRYGGY